MIGFIEKEEVSAVTEWRKSSYSHDRDCVEVKWHQSNSVLVRDSKQGDTGPVLTFQKTDWRQLVRALATEDSS